MFISNLYNESVMDTVIHSDEIYEGASKARELSHQSICIIYKYLLHFYSVNVHIVNIIALIMDHA